MDIIRTLLDAETAEITDLSVKSLAHQGSRDARRSGRTDSARTSRADPYAAARARVAALRAAGPLPPLRPCYTPQRASLYLGDLLRRHGLDEKGRPLSTPLTTGDAGGVKAVVRRVARSGARSLYRVGRQRVAPTLRKWGAA